MQEASCFMINKKLNVIVLAGGPSTEHEVSLASGGVILNALDRNKYNATQVTITKEGKWLLPATGQKLLGVDTKGVVPLETGRAIEHLKTQKSVDVVFIAMHGTYGEDGTVQGFLEMAGVPYTGSNVLASALAMDKLKSAELFTFHGLNVPRYIYFSPTDWASRKNKIIKTVQKIGLPCFIKPHNNGSSVGITKVKKLTDLEKAIKLASSYSNKVLAQEFIDGPEVTCAVLDEGHEARALPPTQIIPKAGFFDYHSKYTPGATEEITPARLPARVIKNIQTAALKSHRVLGCSGLSRTDMIVGKDGSIYVLELNTIPGMTKTSLCPQAAAAAGISFPELLDRIIQAVLNQEKAKRLIKAV